MGVWSRTKGGGMWTVALVASGDSMGAVIFDGDVEI